MKFGSFSVVLALLWTLSEADSEVVCVFGESCVLACSFPTGQDVLIHWKQAETYVHSYYNQRDQLGNQDPAFRGRTSLFGLQIAGGNASLRLEGVRVQDEGRYQCYTSTTAGNKEAFTQLSVTAPVKAVRVHREGNSLTCSSSWIYPEPELRWASSPPLQTPSSSSLQNRTRVQRTQQQLYNISSSLLLPEGEADGSYSCTVSTASSSRTATLRRLTQSFSMNSITTLSCSNSSGRSLVWRFNHSQSILSRAGPDAEPAVSEGWRPHVGGLSESGSLTLKDLSEHQEGEYTCELSGSQETTLTTTYLRVEGPTGRSRVGLIIGSSVVFVAVLLALVVKNFEKK
ncbi:CD276 antigen-like isoform 2-T2 [Menidia menidia]